MDTKVTLKYKGDEEYYTVNDRDNRVDIDMLPRDEKQSQSPMELLLSAIIACAAVDIVSMVKKRRKTFVDLTGEAVGERRDEHPRKYTAVNIHYVITSPDLTEEEAERIISLAVEKYCSVASSVNESMTLTHSFTIER